ncbi:MAG: hypothetical protein K6E78_11145, partial [Treponema sp.]|nr:hypothetical protein [Treponema sp.]
MKRLFSVLFILSAFTFSSFSQTAAKGQVDQAFLNDFVRKNWTTADGLPDMTITALLQNKKGYVYAGTYDGLVRFDGVEFVCYNSSIDPKYNFTSVRSIFEDSYGNLWVGHNDEGVSCFAPDGTIIQFTTKNGLPHNSIRAICEDLDHNIWFGTASGLCYLNKEHNFVVPNGLKEIGQETIQVSQLFCDSAGRVWITTAIENELFVFSNNHLEHFNGITKIKNPSVNTVWQEKNGALWFGISPHYAVRIKDTEETVYDIGHDHTEGTVVNEILQDSNGNYWFALDSGLTVIHNGSYTYYDKRNGLADDYINRIIQDREGNLWIGFNRGGIEKLSQGKFRTVTMPIAVNAICEDPLRNLTWLGADDGLYCYKDNDFVNNFITEICKGQRVRHVEFTKDKELLVSFYSTISQLCVSPDNKIKSWSVPQGLAGLKCRVAIKTSNNDFYVGTTQGLSIIDGKTEKITTLNRSNGFDNEFIMCLYEDKDGLIWVGTDGGGIFVLEDKKIVRHYTTEDGLVGNVIFKIAPIEDKLWICTGAGISAFDEEKNNFFCFNTHNGLISGGIFQMICDYTRTVWMTTNRGVCSIGYEDLLEVIEGKKSRISVKFYGSSDGLISGGVTSTSLSMKDSLGRIWLTLIDGFSIYDPVRSGKNKEPPKIEIQEYTIDTVKKDYNGENIIIPPSGKRLNIKFTGLSFISSDSMTFSYKLAGFDKDYSEWNNNRMVSYTNLRPGTYQFTVRSQNSDEIKSDPCEPIIIIKKPYIWQEAWFWIVIAFTLAGTITLAVLSKIHKMKKYQIELEQKVEERTHDLMTEKDKTEKLLLNILPKDVAEEKKEHPDKPIAKKIKNVTVLFTDIVGFTKISDGLSADQVVAMLNGMIDRFDIRAQNEGIEKIKTIGDAYMAACGFEDDEGSAGALKMVKYAQGIMQDVMEYNRSSQIQVQIRLGINTGDLVAGIIGKTKWIYDVWGDTVNVASRME